MSSKDLTYLYSICEKDLDERMWNEAHGRIVNEVLPKLIEQFAKKGKSKENVEDAFIEVYIRVMNWICEKGWSKDFELLFYNLRQATWRYLIRPYPNKTVELPGGWEGFSAEQTYDIEKEMEEERLVKECFEELTNPTMKEAIKLFVKILPISESVSGSVSGSDAAKRLRTNRNNFFQMVHAGKIILKNCVKQKLQNRQNGNR